MKVKLDLRPRSLVETKRKKLNATRVIIVSLLLSFVLLGGTTLGLAFMKSLRLGDEITMLKDRIALQKVQKKGMETEIKRLSATENMYVQALKLLQEELPSLEFMNAIETSLPLGVWIANVAVTPGKAVIKGTAYHENDVVNFAKGLLDSGIVSAVDFPVTTRVTKGDKSLVDYSLSCTVRDIAAIASAARVEEGVKP